MGDEKNETGVSGMEAVTVQQLAEALQVHPETIRREIRRRHLAAFRVARSVRILKTTAVEYLCAHEWESGHADPDIAAVTSPHLRHALAEARLERQRESELPPPTVPDPRPGGIPF